MAGTIRRFTNNDWCGWGGAERFENGSEPFIYEGNMNGGFVELSIIADKNGICIVITSEDGDNITMDTWEKEMKLSALRAAGELKHIVDCVNAFDSAPELAYALDHNGKGLEGFEYYGEC